ncbi:hypothetical protein [Leifsonia sp. Leaf264]|uniref:hypothetical protein n=1 Tax=Leifsonia sp. Leaf264 TaxID=1736314 RepID=UPI000700CC7B|nr:hypothetical protein [Leifsonia sp. Leaf264]KQO97740.1 hypothetical protein ASF30_15215 [Leifsonia sp. Leaf264]
MSHVEAFDVIDAGEGRWDVQRRQSLSVVGHVWRTAAGFLLWDWADRQLGTFSSLSDALRTLWAIENRTFA